MDVFPAALSDMHCHLGFSAHAAELAHLFDEAGAAAFSATVTPSAFPAERAACATAESVHASLGFHPWWVGDDAENATQLAQFEELLGTTRFVAEVGLDFAPAHRGSADRQLAVFRRILSACAQQGGKLISLHSVRAAGTMLDLLEQSGCLRKDGSPDGPPPCRAIFHWFSGTSDELHRAIEAGCFFSVGERMLASKKGRAYVQAIPAGRLVLETDLPAAPDCSANSAADEFSQIQDSLHRTLEAILELHSPHTAASLEAAARELIAP